MPTTIRWDLLHTATDNLIALIAAGKIVGHRRYNGDTLRREAAKAELPAVSGRRYLIILDHVPRLTYLAATTADKTAGYMGRQLIAALLQLPELHKTIDNAAAALARPMEGVSPQLSQSLQTKSRMAWMQAQRPKNPVKPPKRKTPTIRRKRRR